MFGADSRLIADSDVIYDRLEERPLHHQVDVGVPFYLDEGAVGRRLVAEGEGDLLDLLGQDRDRAAFPTALLVQKYAELLVE